MFRRAFLILLLLACQANAATLYVRSSDGNDGDSGATWALAKATLAGAFTAASAGDTIYVSDNHAETQASAMTLTSPGTEASPVLVLCVDDSAEPPTALATTATISTTGANYISTDGFAYVYGITLSASDGANNGGIVLCTAANPAAWWMDSCRLKINTTNASPRLYIGTTPASTAEAQDVWLHNTVCEFGSASQSILCRQARMRWTGIASSVAGTVPTTLFISQTGSGIGATCTGVDLSAVSGNLINGANDALLTYLFKDCKLHASVTPVTGNVASQGAVRCTLINCDSADTNYRYHKQNYQGTITQETTIVRTGGATDGTTPISRKMVTTANSKYFSPLESDPILFWNETTGSNITVTIPVITDNVTLTDAEAWVEVEYLGTSGYPIASTSSDRSTNILASATNQTTDSTSTWTTTGLGTPVKQEFSVTITPQEKGVIRARVMLAKASTTMYFDPEALTTSSRTYMLGADGQVNEGATGSNTIDPLSETIPGL